MLVKVVVVFVFGKARRSVIVVDGRSGALRFVSVGHGLRHGGTRRRLKPAASGREGTRSVTRSVVGSCVALGVGGPQFRLVAAAEMTTLGYRAEGLCRKCLAGWRCRQER